MAWPSAELEFLLLHAAQQKDSDATAEVLEQWVLDLCSSDRLADEHPYHPGVLLRLCNLADSAGMSSYDTEHIRQEIEFLEGPMDMGPPGPVIRKVELLSLTMLDHYMTGMRRMPKAMWVPNSQGLFGAPTTHGEELDDDLWEGRYSGDDAWEDIISRLDHLRPWGALMLDALRRLRYTSVLFWNAAAGTACTLPLRFDAAERSDTYCDSEEEHLNVRFTGDRNIRIKTRFKDALSEAAEMAVDVCRAAGEETHDFADPVMSVDLTLAEDILEQVTGALDRDSDHPYKISLDDRSIMLPATLAYCSRLMGRQSDGPVLATGALCRDAVSGDVVAQWSIPDDDSPAHGLFVRTLERKLEAARSVLTFDRIFIPSNTDPALFEDIPVMGDLPLHAVRVNSLREMLSMWQDQSQRVVSLTGKIMRWDKRTS